MKLTRDQNELVIKEAPGCLWIFGLFFIVIAGSFVYGSLGGFSNYKSLAQWEILAAFFMGSFGVIIGFWIIYSAPVTKLTIDKQHNLLVHTRRGITGKTEKTYSLTEIKEFTLIEDDDMDGDPIFALGLELTSGETVRISSLSSPQESYKRDFIFTANCFLEKQLPSYSRDENGG